MNTFDGRENLFPKGRAFPEPCNQRRPCPLTKTINSDFRSDHNDGPQQGMGIQ